MKETRTYLNQTGDKGIKLSEADPRLLELINIEFKLTKILDFQALFIKYPEYFI